MNVGCANYELYVQEKISMFVDNYMKSYQGASPTFVCIGTPSVTGDAIGPMVGSALSNLGYTVYGTMTEPITAKNVQDIYNKLWVKSFVNSPLIAIDAATGETPVGTIDAVCGAALYPGAGVGKKLTPIGNSVIIATTGKDMEDLLKIPREAISKIANNIAYNIHREFTKRR